MKWRRNMIPVTCHCQYSRVSYYVTTQWLVERSRDKWAPYFVMSEAKWCSQQTLDFINALGIYFPRPFSSVLEGPGIRSFFFCLAECTFPRSVASDLAQIDGPEKRGFANEWVWAAWLWGPNLTIERLKSQGDNYAEGEERGTTQSTEWSCWNTRNELVLIRIYAMTRGRCFKNPLNADSRRFDQPLMIGLAVW